MLIIPIKWHIKFALDTRFRVDIMEEDIYFPFVKKGKDIPFFRETKNFIPSLL
jgi:hypothetical protein